MSKKYSEVSSDVLERLEAVRAKHHAHLEAVSIAALFVFTDEDEAVLQHSGYPASAVTKVVGLKERAAGMADALIVIDRHTWSELGARQKDALLDHELTHLMPEIDSETGATKQDSLGRMKLKIRKHDHQIGWFTEVAERHGENSPELQQVAALINGGGQMYFDFTQAKQAA